MYLLSLVHPFHPTNSRIFSNNFLRPLFILSPLFSTDKQVGQIQRTETGQVMLKAMMLRNFKICNLE